MKASELCHHKNNNVQIFILMSIPSLPIASGLMQKLNRKQENTLNMTIDKLFVNSLQTLLYCRHTDSANVFVYWITINEYMIIHILIQKTSTMDPGSWRAERLDKVFQKKDGCLKFCQINLWSTVLKTWGSQLFIL